MTGTVSIFTAVAMSVVASMVTFVAIPRERGCVCPIVLPGDDASPAGARPSATDTTPASKTEPVSVPQGVTCPPQQPCPQAKPCQARGGVSATNKGLTSWQTLMVQAQAKLRPRQSIFGWWMHDVRLRDVYPRAAAKFRSYYDVGNSEGDDKTLHHRYDLGYAQLFEPIRALDVPIRLIEIGLGCTYPNEGASVRTWGKYYPSMNLTMIEFHSACRNGYRKHKPAAPKGGWQFYLADGTKRSTARRVLREANNEKFDVVLEDASHIHQHQIDSFHAWWPLLKVGGVYVVEDLHTSFMGGVYGPVHRTGVTKDGMSFFNYLTSHVHAHTSGPTRWDFHWQRNKFPAEAIGQVQCFWSMCFVHKISDEALNVQSKWRYSGSD